MKDADLKLLNAIYQNVKMGVESMEELMGLFKADDLQDITIFSTPLEEIIKNIYRGKDE